ncbi:MAG: MMPL family transporter [Saprospiraceae bacterium]|nr:MMPL family transporter [Saprospiraceae bacterium]
MKYRFLILIFNVGLIGFCLYLSQGIRFDFNFQEYFPQQNQDRISYEKLLIDFPTEESEIIILIKDDSIFSPPVFSEIVQLSDSIRRSEAFKEVQGIANLPSNILRAFAPMYDKMIAGPVPDRFYESLKNRVTSHPILRNQLISDDGKITVIRCILQKTYANDQGRKIANDYLNTLIKNYPSFESIYTTGFSGIRADYAELLKIEQGKLFPMALILFLLFLWLFLGRTIMILLPIINSSIATLFTMALMAITETPFTIVSSGIPMLILIIGVADTFHIYHHFKHHLTEDGKKAHAIIEAYQLMAKSCFLTTLTTIVGFIALIFTDLPVLKEFGLFTSCGILFSYYTMMTLLPIWLSFLSYPQLNFSPPFKWANMNYLIGRFQNVSGRLLFILMIIVIGLSIGIYRLQDETRVYQGLKKESVLSKKILATEKNLGGILPMSLVLDVPENNMLYSKSTLNSIRNIQNHLLDENQIVGSVFSVDNIVNFIFQKGISEVPADLNSLDMQEVTEKLDRISMDNPTIMNSIVNQDLKRLHIKTRLKDVGSGRFESFIKELNSYLESNHAGEQWTITGLPNMSLQLSKLVSWNIVLTISIACIAIFLGFILFFKSLRLAIISLVPNIIPLISILGFMGWAGIELQPSVVIVFSIAYGIAVNDTIHFLYQYRLLHPHKIDSTSSIRLTLQLSGKAIIQSSIILMVGFSIFLISDFLGLYYLGLLLIIGILSAVISDLIILPLLLIRFSK